MKETQFNQLILTHSSFLKAFAIKLTANTELANDLVQDTIYRALSNQEKFRGGNLRAWLATIMRNIFINGTRMAKRRNKISLDDSRHFLMETTTNVVAHNSGDASILMGEVETEIDKLHPDLKTPFIMRYHGFKYDEIAQQLDAPIGTIKSRIHHARKYLIRKLGNMYGTTHLAELAA